MKLLDSKGQNYNHNSGENRGKTGQNYGREGQNSGIFRQIYDKSGQTYGRSGKIQEKKLR